MTTEGKQVTRDIVNGVVVIGAGIGLYLIWRKLDKKINKCCCQDYKYPVDPGYPGLPNYYYPPGGTQHFTNV